MFGLEDSAVILFLALLLFGPKKLPVLARQLGKLMGDFRRASSEFRTQMEEELRISEQAERQKQVAAIEASAPPISVAETIPETEGPLAPRAATEEAAAQEISSAQEPITSSGSELFPEIDPLPKGPTELQTNSIAPPGSSAPLPIATSGELSIHPPPTGLPVANGSSNGTATAQAAEPETETLHG